MSLKLRANVFFALLLLLSMFGSIAVLISNAKNSVEAEVRSTMDATAHIITVTLAGGSLNRETSVSEHMYELVRALSEIRSLHILLFDRQGLMFEGTPEKEFDTQPPAWFVKLLFPDITPLSRRFGTGHMVIYPAPMLEISERWQDIRAIVALGMIIFVVVALFIYWGVGWLMRPLNRLLDALAGFERGDLHMRLPRFSLKEMDKISQSFNRVGDALEQSTTENRRLAMLVRQSGDAILSLDHAGYITFCNAAAERLFAGRPGLLGESLASMPFQENSHAIIAVLNGFQSVENLETTLARQDGEAVSLLISTVPLTESDGCV